MSDELNLHGILYIHVCYCWVIKHLFHGCLVNSQNLCPSVPSASGNSPPWSSSSPRGNSFDYSPNHHEITVYNNMSISKIFSTIVVLLYLILNLTPILLGGSSTGSGVITILLCHFLLSAATCNPENRLQSTKCNFQVFSSLNSLLYKMDKMRMKLP